ncbi:MAG TPA: cupin domain-containing protein [Chloroflexota bacterium]|jgi:mannose-6-phosphate isomerase-like protein (cupin superfamily)|nr:cupin domain-containing protein [Chloroflexota bacterium]
MPKWHRQAEPDAFAPDGAEIRNLIHREQGATRLSMAEALVPAGGRTAKVYHQTIYEEIWYFTAGTAEMHVHQPGAEQEEVLQVEPGDTVLLPPGYGFWVRNTGTGPLTFLCCGSPPWPGDQEAQPWPPPDR